MLRVACDDLSKSGISEEEADIAEMYTVKNAQSVYADFNPYPALVIPYPDPWTNNFLEFERDGQKLPFCRVRYYARKNKVQSFKKKKELRYTQPKNSGVHAYFPIVDDVDWVSIAEDPDIPVMITEGEKKALCASLCGIPTIGLGGVYNFAHDGELLPELERFEWSRRTVYICYDSDAADNTKIQVAEGRLATELSMKRNANVFLVRIPEQPGGAKVGVDDYVVAQGDDALWNLLENAPAMRKIDREILRMNANVAWIEKEGLVLDLQTDLFIKKGDFIKGSRFSSIVVEQIKERGQGVKLVSVSDLWLTHPHARRYADTVFRPGTDDKAVQLPGGGVAYNRFRGLQSEPGDVAPFFDLYEFIMSKTDEFDYDLIWKMFAYFTQNLGKKLGLGLILLGKQGGGKTLFSKIIAEMFGVYGNVVSSKELKGDFNPWVETSLCMVMNEAKSVELKYNMDVVKGYVTDDTQPMNDKYRPRREVVTYFLTIFNSNERSAGALPDDDRRFIVIKCPDTHPDGDDFYAPIYEWMDKNGPKRLLHYFQHYDLKGWKPPRHAPQTREKRMAFWASLTPVQKLAHNIRSASQNLVAQWVSDALDWAASDSVMPQQVGLAADIQASLVHIKIRPFYTPEELVMLFPAITGTLQMGRVKSGTPESLLARQLIQEGVDYLKCTDNFDGFYYQGRIQQFLIICDSEEYEAPITQQDFDRLMADFPTYREYRAQKRRKRNKKG